MKKCWLIVVPLILFSLVLHSVAQQPKHRVVFAITSPDVADWMLTAGNIRNLKQGLDPGSVEIELVVYGPGISMVKRGSGAADSVTAMQQEGVVIVACENSMRHAQIAKADLIDGVSTVPSGVVEVVKRQESGWSYIKAGR